MQGWMEGLKEIAATARAERSTESVALYVVAWSGFTGMTEQVIGDADLHEWLKQIVDARYLMDTLSPSERQIRCDRLCELTSDASKVTKHLDDMDRVFQKGR